MTIEAVKAIKMVYANTTKHDWPDDIWDAICQAIEAEKQVAFKIYKPTPPRGAIPNVRDAELPWVYDQDPSSGNVASMWVTPVHTHPQTKQDNTDLDAICQDLQEKTYTQAMRIAELEAKLAEAENQEPVTWGVDWGKAGDTPCFSIIKRLLDGRIEVVAAEYAPYTHPQLNVTTSDMKQEHVDKTAKQRHEWVGLTDEEIEQGCKESWVTLQAWQSAVWWAEAKLKEKNT